MTDKGRLADEMILFIYPIEIDGISGQSECRPRIGRKKC